VAKGKSSRKAKFMAKAPCFEIVRDNKGFHGRFWSGTRIIWWTESYREKRDALHAIHLLEEHAPSAPIYDLTT
jgi:uncharacterized protein YegP (UPF0339 family)